MLPVFWWDIDLAVKTTITQRIQTEVRGIHFFYKSSMLFIKLPSGRLLSYVKPRIGEKQYGGESVTYEGVGSTKKWERIESYGPKFVENIVQAVSRDILCYAMKTLRHCFIVGHVHDELIIEYIQEHKNAPFSVFQFFYKCICITFKNLIHTDILHIRISNIGINRLP